MMNGKLLLALLTLVPTSFLYAMEFKISMAMIDKDPVALENVLKSVRKNKLNPTKLGYRLLSDDLTLETARVLVQYGADIQSKTKTLGRSALFNACSRGDAALVGYFLNHGLDPDEPDAQKRTAWDEAKTQGNPEIIALLERAVMLRLFLKKHKVPNVLTLLRNREIYGTFHSPH